MGRSGRSLLLIMVCGLPFNRAWGQPTANGGSQPNGAATATFPTPEELAVSIVSAGNSSRGVREQARASLPLAKLNADQLRMANLVLSDVSLFRRLPTVRCPIDPRVYEFFTQHPEVAVGIWRVLGISQLQLTATGPDVYMADTGDGSSGTLHVLLRSPTQSVVYCDGLFKSPMLAKPIKARALVCLTVSTQPLKDGTSQITHTVDMFVSFPSLAVETIARMVSPLSNKYADRNMEEITSFLRMMDLSMSRQPGWVEQLALLLDDLGQERTQQLIKVTAAIHVDALRRSNRLPGEIPVTGAAATQSASGASDASRK
ncbi:MAG: hypothetical protein KF774_20985 [Planctomyces sp.]|nr:hypothetical protein [Planctomyces sp.]